MLTLFCLLLFVNSVVIIIGSFVVLLWWPRDFCCLFVSVFVFEFGLWFVVCLFAFDCEFWIAFGVYVLFICYLLFCVLDWNCAFCVVLEWVLTLVVLFGWTCVLLCRYMFGCLIVVLFVLCFLLFIVGLRILLVCVLVGLLLGLVVTC